MRRETLLYLVFGLSGFAGLGYEIVWLRMFSVGLGHEVPALFAVVAAYFGGFALGAWLLDGRVSASVRPGRWYAGLELGIGLWALITIAACGWINDWIFELTGPTPSPLRHWSVSFLVPFLVLLPATGAMGATLAAMDRLVARLRRKGDVVGGLYAANTLGAVLGILASTFLLMPLLGLRATLLVCGAANALCAGVVLFGAARGEESRPPAAVRIAGRPGDRRLRMTLFVTGLLGIGYEILAVRVMAQVLENTVYSFASALSIFLVATAIGSAVFQRRGFSRPGRALLATLFQGLAISVLVGTWTLSGARTIYEGTRDALGAGLAGSVAAEMITALCIFLLPSLLMGATFAALAQLAREHRGGVGRALALNTLGGAVAPLLFGVLLVPAAGAKWALVCVALGYLVLIPELRVRRLWPALALPVVLAAVPSSVVGIAVPGQGRVIAHRDGVLGLISVVESETGERFLHLNNGYRMGGGRGLFGERRQAHIPLLLHPAPRTALFLGLGTGGSARAIAAYENLEAVAVELVPEIAETSIQELFVEQEPASEAGGRERITVVSADARRYVRASGDRYDVIVADLFHPARDGSGNLYTREHFEAVRRRMAPEGIFCQWIPLHQLSPELVRLIVRTYLDAFPGARAFLGLFNAEQPALGLIAHATPAPPRYAASWLATRPRGPARGSLLLWGLSNDLALFGTMIAGPDELARYAGTGPINTDDRPRVTFRAPGVHYRKRSGSTFERDNAQGNLREMLDAFAPSAEELIEGSRAQQDRLQAYWAARDAYLGAELRLARGELGPALQDYLESYRLSPDFSVVTARLPALLNEISRVNPELAGDARARMKAIRDRREAR